ncbi:MAG: glycoside hydrolase family 9 protein [Verrucomicrobia bacterium]|nr:glycoside hydrolase family 9 protein [Verrucomicrobiota bacterium]
MDSRVPFSFGPLQTIRRSGIFFVWITLLTAWCVSDSQTFELNETTSLRIPAPGSQWITVLSPRTLQLTLINTREPDPERVAQWDFTSATGGLMLPEPGEFVVTVDGQMKPVNRVGFKRRVIYAPLLGRDLRIRNDLYLELATPVSDGARIEVHHPAGGLWSKPTPYQTTVERHRLNPAIHVNQVGYLPFESKKAMVGFFPGNLGELEIPPDSGYRILQADTGEEVYRGNLVPRPDRGFTHLPTPYQQVLEADFTALDTPGTYRVYVPGLGTSWPFQIGTGVAGSVARTFALGLYHQRCGTGNSLPHTRFTHDPCHTAPAAIPTPQSDFAFAWKTMAEASAPSGPGEAVPPAPRLQDESTQLFPFQNAGSTDVSGGHHDAGDYSKYTINSAALVHSLIFAADVFPNVADLDNLGLPESGDGKSDLIQEAKWETDFLARMQDPSGGFYFLVYPRDRKYENDVLPDHGDAQVVWPINTAATAAATAALAEAGSSPVFKAQFPEAAALYLQKARLGWSFLENALSEFGQDGAYQKITHYGDTFGHGDELAWAAAALFAATGEEKYETHLRQWFDPEDPETRRWGWWRLFEGYGCAVRTYAFAARSGRLAQNQLNTDYRERCERELLAAAQDQYDHARANAYGTSFPFPNKRNRDAGWYFSTERAFDLAVALQLTDHPGYFEALLSNFNYELGCNPVNVSFVTGLGFQRQREMVHQYAQNDQRTLPPTGFPIGNIQEGFAYLENYKRELGALTFPPDSSPSASYAFYDRWADSFNTTTEFTVQELGRSMASAAFLMARAGLAEQPWMASPGTLTGVPDRTQAGTPITAATTADATANPTTVWETADQEPHRGGSFTFTPRHPGEHWIEAETQYPDGRRVFASKTFTVSIDPAVPPNATRNIPLVPGPETVALFHLDSDLKDTTETTADLLITGSAFLDTANAGWMSMPSGRSLRVSDLGDRAITRLPGRMLFSETGTHSITLSAMLYIRRFRAHNRANAKLLSLYEGFNASLELIEDRYSGPQIRGGTRTLLSGDSLTELLSLHEWHHLEFRIDQTGYTVRLDGVVIAALAGTELGGWGRRNETLLHFGDFDGWIDEVVVERNTPLFPLRNTPRSRYQRSSVPPPSSPSKLKRPSLRRTTPLSRIPGAVPPPRTPGAAAPRGR